MDLNNLNKWLTLGANAGVLAGIILLAYEVNQNTATMQLSAREDRTEALFETLSMISDSDVLLSVLAKINWSSDFCNPDSSKVSALSEEEKIIMETYLKANWFRWDNAFFQYREGALDEKTHSSNLNGIAQYAPWFELFDIRQARNVSDIFTEFGFDVSTTTCSN